MKDSKYISRAGCWSYSATMIIAIVAAIILGTLTCYPQPASKHLTMEDTTAITIERETCSAYIAGPITTKVYSVRDTTYVIVCPDCSEDKTEAATLSKHQMTMIVLGKMMIATIVLFILFIICFCIGKALDKSE